MWICHAVLPLDEGESFSEDGLFTACVAADGGSSDDCGSVDAAADNIELRNSALADVEAWSRLRAVAVFRAAATRHGGAGFEDDAMPLALAGFEPNHWEWPAAKTDVAFLWSWQRAGRWCHEFIWARLDMVLERGAVPAPQGSDSDGELWDRLVEAAQQETSRRRAPVKYLGFELPRAGEGRVFEPDPSKWPPRDDSKTKLPVTFEWLGVSIPSGEPLRAQSSFSNLVHLGHAIPHCCSLYFLLASAGEVALIFSGNG
jgi:hypothetical protein